MGSGVDSSAVWGIGELDNGDIVVTGSFNSINSDTNMENIAGWNGNSWYPFSTGLSTGAIVYGFIVFNNKLYAAGSPNYYGTNYTDGFAEWRNGAWLYGDVDLPGVASVYEYAVDNQNNFYVGYYPAGTAIAAGITSISTASGANNYPIVRLDGPGTVLRLENVDTGSVIIFDSLILLTGETLTISFEPDNLSIKSSFRGDCLSYVAPGSDFSEFYLKPGTNKVSLLMTGTDSDTDAVIYYSPRYWSLDQTKHGV